MQAVREKSEANAAERLKLPPGRQASEELPRFAAFLKVETHRLKMLHRAGGGGVEICRARAAIIDILLRYLWDGAKQTLSEAAQKSFPDLALIAIGGFGRAELNPFSDIDFMFLHSGQVAGSRALPHLSRLIDGILYPLWDLGFKVGHSVRTIDECVNVANSDMQAKTSLIESRLITGDQKLFEKFQKTLVGKSVAGHEQEYIEMRINDQAGRRAKFGNSASMQEPNIKNGCGGLRDYQNLLWMAFFKYRTRTCADLKENGFINPGERKQLESAYDFLLRVRTEMHYHTNRAVDVLGKNMQPAIAHNLGYRERSPSRRIEDFMRDVYSHSRNIFLLTRTLEQRLALIPQPVSRLSLRAWLPSGKKPAVESFDGFKFINGEIHAGSNKIFREQPMRLMRVFLYAQQRGLRLHPDLAQLIRNELALVDRSFLSDRHVRETFLTILSRRGSVSPILRAMHEVGFLGKYIPEFGRLTCLVQHEFYHQYTADEHTLVCLEQLDRIWEARNPPHSAYAPLFHNLDRPYLLYLAMLLHDVGKAGEHGDHAEASAHAALKVARRLDLDGASSHALMRVIEHHLLLAAVSQRRDLDDPTVIHNVARQIENQENLALLTLLTFADALATSDKLWNGFKDSLLWTLHHKTMELMTGGTEFARAQEKQLELLREDVRRIMPDSLSEEELEAHFASLPPRYFQIHSAQEILGDLLLAHRFMRLQISEEDAALTPVVNWNNEPDRACAMVKICTWDRAGLFSKIAGSFSASGLNILSAQVFTRADGFVLDTFSVTEAKTGNLPGADQRDKFEAMIKDGLASDEPDFHALIAKQKISRPVYHAYTGERIATAVRFDNDSSETRTVIEIETEDRLGLLYVISEALSELRLDISAAKIVTEKGAAIDSFYVHEKKGGKVEDAARQNLISRRTTRAVHDLDGR
jgi:[protein-PII] uridylyltransferase